MNRPFDLAPSQGEKHMDARLLFMKEGLEKHFGIKKLKKYILTGTNFHSKPKLNFVRFDHWLSKRHKKFKNKEISMAECISKNYGDEALKFIRACL